MADIDNKNPWTTLSNKKVYDNPWISVNHRDVLNPSGKPGIYGVVEFKNVAVGVVPLDEEFYTYLVGQYRYTLNEYSWEIPEGGCPIGSSPMDTAKRELLEETGLTAKIWTPLLEINTSNSVTNEYGICFIAQELTEGIAAPEETELLEVIKLPFEKALAMVMEGKIKDSLSIAALLKTKLLIENKAIKKLT